MTDLRSHVALVTGGSRGIGAAIVRALAAVGAAVAIQEAQNGKTVEWMEKVTDAQYTSQKRA